MKIIENHLPSYCYSKHNMKSVDGAVVHFVSAMNIDPENPFSLDEIINIFKKYKVSANYLIERDGTVIELVPGLHKAYHAGKSIMNKREGCNSFTIGIELVGGTKWPYTDEQILNLGELLAQLMTEHQFTFNWVQGHDMIRGNWNTKYPDKKASVKIDPGKHFPWEDLSGMVAGIGGEYNG